MLDRIPGAFDELVTRFFGSPDSPVFGGGAWCPALDIADQDDGVVVKVELPGMKAEDIDLSVDGNSLTISGEKKDCSEDEGGDYYHVERRYGTFQRTITLPSEVDADKIKATYNDGVLTVHLPKSESAKLRRIPVSS
jgi:HSP20 family protein